MKENTKFACHVCGQHLKQEKGSNQCYFYGTLPFLSHSSLSRSSLSKNRFRGLSGAFFRFLEGLGIVVTAVSYQNNPKITQIKTIFKELKYF